MKIVIAGAGEVGTFLAELLSNDKQDIIVIDIDEERLDYINSNYDVLTVLGSASSFKILEEAKVKNADIFIAATENEHVNLVASSLAKKLGAKRCVSRVNNMEYIQTKSVRHFRSLGIDNIINPDKLIVDEIIGLIKRSASNEVFEFSKGELSLFVTRLSPGSMVIGKTLKEANTLNKDFEFRALLIVRDNTTFIPKPNDVFKENDQVYVISRKHGLKRLMEISGQSSIDIKDVMILGGGEVGMLTAMELENNYNVKLIEKDRARCDELADLLDRTLVLNADGRDIDVLQQENIDKMDAFIAVTDSSETNIFTSLIAKQHNVKKIITEVENVDFIKITKDLKIEGIINKKLITASHITRYTIRADVISVKLLNTAKADVIEVVALKGSKITKGKIKDLDIPKDIIIGGVIRGNDSFIATGDTEIQPGDIVVSLVLPTALHKIEKFFS
jgi:trk system potassium uptake protein TrkA